MRGWGLALSLGVAAVASGLTLDESPAGPEEWGFRPIHNETVDLNPPAFTWRPVSGAAEYVLEIARDVTFTDIVYRAERSRWSNHCPSAALPLAPLYWRYAALDESGGQSAWSTVRAFSVPDSAVVFPQPSIAHLVEQLPADHPRLYFRPEEVPWFRALAHEEMKDVWERIRASADKLLASPPDTSEPPLYPAHVEHKSGEWREIWWGNRRRVIAVADGAALLGFAYQITGERRYAEGARTLLLAMTEWDPEGSTQYRYNDEAAMPALKMAPRAYDWIHDELSEADRARIAAMMRIRGKQCFDHLMARPHLWRPYASHSNRAWHFLGELAMAFHGDFPEAETWLDFAMTVFYTAYPVWSDSDGGWHEGTAYWNSYLNRFMYWAFLVRPAFGIDVFERPFFKKTGYYAMYVLPPGTQHGGFADQADRSSSRGVANFMNILAAGAGNPHWKWYAETSGASEGSHYLDFVYHARSQNLEAAAPVELPTSRVFRGTGVAALNSNILNAADNVQFFFKSSPMGSISHGFNANNTFHLNVSGQPLLLNTGRRDVHGSPHHTQWMWSTRSQNAILVNGKEQYRHSPKALGRISHFETSPGVDVVVGEAGASYENLDRWTRRVVFLKPDVIVIHDVLEAPEPSTFDWLLHAPGKFELANRSARYAAEHGQVEAHFLYPAELEITHTDGYDPPPADWATFEIDEWHLTARPKEFAKEQQFLTVLRVNDADAQPRLVAADDGLSLSIATHDGEAVLKFTQNEFQVSHGSFENKFD